MTSTDHNYIESLKCRIETVLSLTCLTLISAEIIQENRFVVKSSQNYRRLTLIQLISFAVKHKL